MTSSKNHLVVYVGGTQKWVLKESTLKTVLVVLGVTLPNKEKSPNAVCLILPLTCIPILAKNAKCCPKLATTTHVMRREQFVGCLFVLCARLENMYF